MQGANSMTQWAGHLIAAALAVFAGVAPCAAQDSGWKSSYGNCTAVQNTLDQNMKQIMTPGNGRVSIAHRGTYSVPLSTSSVPYLAENTMMAYQYAQCLGYPGVEVDLKLTSDGVPVMAHDVNYMRFSTYDGTTDGSFDPAVGAMIDYEGTKKRDYVGSAPTIRSLSWSALAKNLSGSSVKTYDWKGQKRSNFKISDPQSYRLDYILNYAANHDDLKNVVFVLDIQNYPTLAASVAVVDRLNAYNRVIFKVWSEAIPGRKYGDTMFMQNPPTPSGYKGQWVYAFNTYNTSTSSGVLQAKYWDVVSGAEQYATVDNILSDIMFIFAEDGSDSFALGGFELVTTGNDTKDSNVVALRDYLNNMKSQGYHIGRPWGVVRLPDYVKSNCTSDCATFPNGNYAGGAWFVDSATEASAYVRLSSIPDAYQTKRQLFWSGRYVEVEDVRGRYASHLNSPLQRQQFFSATNATISD